MKYHELHLHDHYSILDGLNKPDEYMSRAVELGMTHLAQTNHGTLTGHREFQRAAKAAGITPILGVEGYISATDRFDRRAKNKRDDGTQTFNHIGLLAMNEDGLKNLNALTSEAWRTGFYHKPRIDMELLEEFQEDIIVLSGCLNGLLSKALESGDYDKAVEIAKKFEGIFGERFFIEIQGHNPAEINAGLLAVAEDVHVKPVVTSDCHYALEEDLWIEEAFLILSNKPNPAKGYDFAKSQTMEYLERYNYLYPNRKMTFQKFELFLHSAAEHKAALEKQGIGTEPITNTDIVAKMIGDYPYYEALDLLPSPDKSIKDLDAELRRLVFKGLKERGLADDPVYVKRAEAELKVIKEKGFAVYFLILADIIDWSRKKKIFIGPGRGSGVSSLVNYSLFITNIDPVDAKLLFFRFLDPERDDWPDIDVDFDVRRRYEVKEYVKRKYGYAANIMTFSFFRGKLAIKAAASVLQIPQGEVNAATKMLTEDPEFPVMEIFSTSDATKAFREKYPEVEPLARALEGRMRTTGMHPGGTVLSKEPIEQYIPMQTAADPQDNSSGRVEVIAADMREAADIGLIKYDFLGLNNLTVILETIEALEAKTGKRIDPYDIPLDDDKVYDMLSQGHTRAVFQCEGGPYTNTIIKMGGVHNFEDLVSSNALVRPGAANSSVGENFIKGKATGEFEYIHADAKYFTEETYGQILFQEQQMLLCTEVAGLSMADANKVRAAISKKIPEKLAVWEPAFVEGASRKIGQERAQAVWDDLEKSAQYAFNRAHSVGYSLISYWTAWFKANHPVEYMTAVLNNISGTDAKIKAMFYLMEAKRLGITIKLPHINASKAQNTVEGDAIRMGLVSIKGIAGKSAEKIVSNAPYGNYAQFLAVKGVTGSGINAVAVKALNAIGGAAFDDNPRAGTERENLYTYLNIPEFSAKELPLHTRALFRPVNEFTRDEAFVVYGMVYDVHIGQGWARVSFVDDSGEATAFTKQDTDIKKGALYVLLIGNNSILQAVSIEDLLEGKGGPLGKYLMTEKLSLKDGEYRCLSYKTRRTKAGNKQGDAIFTDGDKNLTGVMVFEGMMNKAAMKLTTSAKCRPTFRMTRSGGLYLQEI